MRALRPHHSIRKAARLGSVNRSGKGEKLRVIDRAVGGAVCGKVEDCAEGFAFGVAQPTASHLTPQASGFRVAIQHDEVDLRAVETLGEDRVIADDGS